MQASCVRDPNRWQQIEQVFNEALRHEGESRSAFLEKACGTDAELRSEVESLLASLAESAPFLESAVQEVAASYLLEHVEPVITEGCEFGQYRVIRLLGQGGMGEVYLANDTRLKRKVALKMLPQRLTRDASSLRRFEQEAQLLSALNHANLLTVFDFCRFEDRYVLVTEFVEGCTLRQLLSEKRVDQNEAIGIALQIAAALSAAHAAGVIHRDIKPENIMLRADGGVKVLDFGISKLAPLPIPGIAERDRTTTQHNSTTGLMLGTPRYMSPEQARGLPVDGRTDLFSLGAVLYELLTGRAAFKGDTQSDVIADILRGEPAPLARSLTPKAKELQPIVDRALSKDRERRFQNAEEMLVDLRRFRQKQESQSRSFGRGREWGVLVACALVALAAMLLLGRYRHQQVAKRGPRSLAVLPFHNLKPGPDTDFLGFSLADEVIAKLGYVKALVVRPSSSVNQYREGSGSPQDLRKMATELNAGMLLTGTYLKDGSNLRITARLIGLAPETVLWQKTLTMKYGDLLKVQDDVAQMIIQGLELQLGPDEKARLKADGAVNSLAYEYYLRGVDLYAVSNFPAAIAMLQRSVSIDPNYAPAWAHLGRAYTTNASLQFGGREDYRRAETAYDKAIAANPVFAEPRIYMANLLTDTGRVEEAVTLLRVALQSSPNNAEAHWELGYAYRFGGMLKQSAEECELARRLDPEVKINSSALNTYLYLGQYQKFLDSLPANDSPLLVFYHGLGSYYQHKFGEAGSDFDRAYDLSPDLLPAQIGKSLSEGLQGNLHGGLDLVRETEHKMVQRGVSDPEAMYKMAQAYAVLGDSGDALRMLQRSTQGGFFCYSYMAADPLLTSLRSFTRFDGILQQARQRAQQFQQRFGPKAS